MVKWSLWNFAHSMCCHGMCKILKHYDTIQWSYTNSNSPWNLNYNGKIVHEMGPWKGSWIWLDWYMRTCRNSSPSLQMILVTLITNPHPHNMHTSITSFKSWPPGQQQECWITTWWNEPPYIAEEPVFVYCSNQGSNDAWNEPLVCNNASLVFVFTNENVLHSFLQFW